MYVCVCVCVCVCACVRACLRSGGARSKTDRQITLWASGASKRSNTHKICPNGRLRECSLKHRLCLKWARTVGRKSDVCQYIVLKWQTGAWTINVNQRTKCERKSPTALNLNNVIALISINLYIQYQHLHILFFFNYVLLSKRMAFLGLLPFPLILCGTGLHHLLVGHLFP